ncbi:MAG: macro domain-containing protein [Planctomycetes bacterium]|nr:macro domain-containing protein [Planctomycetota bacterium]
MIECRKGDLLKDDVEALVNTVNTVGVMGKGVALQFKKAFPDNFEAYQKACKEGKVKLGEMFLFDLGQLHNPKVIINFPTKKHWKAKSQLEDIQSGLDALVQLIKQKKIGSVALPPLGCGLGGLDWNVVRPLIERTLSPLKNVQVNLYEPAGAPRAQEMVTKTSKPRMTNFIAAMLGLMNRYGQLGYRLTLLEVHKLLYFLQEAGEPLNLKFEKKYYGPYADTLRHVLNRCEGHYTQGFGDAGNKPDLPMCTLPDSTNQAQSFLKNQPETRQRFDRVANLIEGFETPYGMELLASVQWVATRENAKAKVDQDAALEGISSWNKRKKNLFPPQHVIMAWSHLRDDGWF